MDINRQFHASILTAYLGRDRDVLEATAMLQIEASELSELFLKKKWYNKEFTEEELLSEAGDVLNFLTFILLQNNLTLTDAMCNNIQKLKNRGWID